MRIRLILYGILSLVSLRGTAQSVFSDYNTIKIATTQEGIYKIDLAFFAKAGLDASNINPHKIQIYGMPGGEIPQANSIDYPFSPQALSIFKQADADEQLEDNEFILFYADLAKNISFNANIEQFEYATNAYADSLFYYVVIDSNEPQHIIPSSQQVVSGAALSLDWHHNLYWHERDLVNVFNSGRQWFGESFLSEKTQSFSFDLENTLKSSEQIFLVNGFLGQANGEASVASALNNFDLNDENFTPISEMFFPAGYPPFGDYVTSTASLSATVLNNAENLTIDISLKAVGGANSAGYLDYIFVQVPEENRFEGEQLILRNVNYELNSAFKVMVANAGNSFIWNVTNVIEPEQIPHNVGTFNFERSPSDSQTKFVVFEPLNTFEPVFIEQINSFNLQQSANTDFIIISHPKFLKAARRLADHRSAHSGFSVNLVNLNDVFNEYGSGRKDVSGIRNYIKDIYQRSSGKLKYVLLMGAASYDYKDRINNNSNYVPIYQSRSSINPLSTYASDDFYAFMDENEGYWEETNDNMDEMDLGVGRIPAKTIEEADNIVDKIIKYDSDPALLGKWRNELYFVADDEDNPNGRINQFYGESEELVDYIVGNFDYFNINKLFVGSFEQEVFASTQRSPAMQDAMNKMMDKGALIVNYIGHGAEETWTNEAILTSNMIGKWSNSNHFPLFVTATCEFGRHDNPTIESGAQKLLLKKNAGAIGLLTTARPVFAISNLKLSKAFYENSFRRENGTPQKLGDIIKDTKNGSLDGVNNRNFILLGDPSMTLGMPKDQIIIDEIFNESGPTDSLRSLEKITVTGHLENRGGQLLTDFDGALIAELFDKPVEKQTLVAEEQKFNYELYENILYRGKASVKDGSFELTFYLPKEIDYKNGSGKFSLYAYDEDNLKDANGFKTDFSVGGSFNSTIKDNIPPDLTIFLNDSTFINGDKVGSNNDLLIELYDDYGISISQNGLNNGIFYQLDDAEKVAVNDFFYYDIDSYQKGSLEVQLPTLEEGAHQLKVGAVDIFNNPTERVIDFMVVDGDQLNILDFIVYPNPAKEEVTLNFKHSRRGEDVEVTYHVIDAFGKMIFSDKFATSDSNRRDTWNLISDDGQKIRTGMYFITLNVRSEVDNSKTRQIKKLIVIN